MVDVAVEHEKEQLVEVAEKNEADVSDDPSQQDGKSLSLIEEVENEDTVSAVISPYRGGNAHSFGLRRRISQEIAVIIPEQTMGIVESKETFGAVDSALEPSSAFELHKQSGCPDKVSEIITQESEFISFLSQIYF